MSDCGGGEEAASLRRELGREHVGIIITHTGRALKRLRNTRGFYEKTEMVWRVLGSTWGTSRVSGVRDAVILHTQPFLET